MTERELYQRPTQTDEQRIAAWLREVLGSLPSAEVDEVARGLVDQIGLARLEERRAVRRYLRRRADVYALNPKTRGLAAVVEGLGRAIERREHIP